MTVTALSPFDPVLDFWFGTTDVQASVDPARAKRWFEKNDAFDQQIAEKFGVLHGEIVKRHCESWLESAGGRLSYVVVLDQFSRNMFRGLPRAFDHDGQALAAAADGLARGQDKALGAAQRPFLYLPFMHSEELAMQERCVALFGALAAEAPEAARDRAKEGLSYAERHRDIIARFGRFPHRNSALGRTSTPEEWEFLKQPGSSF